LDWDVLIVLDARRVDAFNDERKDRNMKGKMGAIQSAGSNSREWMQANFTPAYRREIGATIYACGNSYSGRLLSPKEFACLNEVWQYGWDESKGTIPARPITDRAITLGRNRDEERLLVHYM
jgi:hypothetical protein